MNHIKAFIIHLERAHNRQPQVEKLMAALPVTAEIVPAVDGKNLADADVARYYQPRLHQPFYPFTLSINEIACFLSHRKAWTTLIEQGCTAGFILEDDAAIGDDFAAAFVLARTFMTPRSLIRFPHRAREKGKTLTQHGNVRLMMPQPAGLGQVAYLLSRSVAEQLLKVTETFDRPIDVALQMFWLTKIRPLSILPSGISEISPQLGGSTLHKKHRGVEKWRREILRPLYRWQIARCSRKYT